MKTQNKLSAPDEVDLRLAIEQIRQKTDNNTKNIYFSTPLEVTFNN